MKKVFDQTVRDLKREVNKKVLKVPGIEQKVLDATSNEPWGPHGTLLGDIAHASRNYHEYQMIMAVIWKRINDTGKNWRHVYKALAVLEYLVSNGSEHVIDEIKEHSYQISTLSDFQYIDSSGRDQGNNVRKKSQSLVVLVNDKERIIEVRQKAAANRDKFRNTSSGGMYRTGSYSSSGDRYDYEGRYGSRDEDGNGYGFGREREYSYRDDDRHRRYGESYNRDGRDFEERYGRDRYRDDDYRDGSQSIDGYGSRSRSSDRERDRSFDDDAQSSSRGSGARADDQYQDGRQLEGKFSDSNVGAPPCYEEAVSESRSPAHSERNGEISATSAPGVSSPPAPRASSPPAPSASSPPAPKAASPSAAFVESTSPAGREPEVDEFDPRGAFSAAPAATAAPTSSTFPATSNSAEMDLLGSLSDAFTPNPLAVMPMTSAATITEADAQANVSGSTFSAAQLHSNVVNQTFEDPFGDSPFKAMPSTDTISDPQPSHGCTPSFLSTMNQNAGRPHVATPTAEMVNTYDYGDTFSGITYSATSVQPPSTNSHILPQELSNSHQETDILADILPPSGPSPAAASSAGFSPPTALPAHHGADIYGNFNSQAGNLVPSNIGLQASQLSGGNFLPPGASTGPVPSNMALQTPAVSATQFNSGNLLPQVNTNLLTSHESAAPVSPGINYQTPGPAAQHNSDVLDSLFSPGKLAPPSSSGSLAIVSQPSKDKFETKSTVWADTLSRGLVNLNISGPKINPLADIGIDFDAINRKEKRMDKPTTAAVTSTVTMGKAMGSGSGIGRAGAGALRPPPNPMMGSGMGMGAGMNMSLGMGGGSGSGMGIGGYGGMNQPMGMGMGMGMGMNMGMGQGGQMPPRSTMPGGYNPMMGTGNYPPQQQYGGGYR